MASNKRKKEREKGEWEKLEKGGGKKEEREEQRGIEEVVMKWRDSERERVREREIHSNIILQGMQT